MNKETEAELVARSELAQRVRKFMRDYPELNTLISGREHSESQIMDAIEDTVAYCTHTPPNLGYMSVQRVPLHILINLVAARLLKSVALLYIRNDISFQTGGTTVQLDQGQVYWNLSDSLARQAEQELVKWKIAENHTMAVRAVAGVHSDWELINIRPIRWYTDDLLDRYTGY